MLRSIIIAFLIGTLLAMGTNVAHINSAEHKNRNKLDELINTKGTMKYIEYNELWEKELRDKSFRAFMEKWKAQSTMANQSFKDINFYGFPIQTSLLEYKASKNFLYAYIAMALFILALIIGIVVGIKVRRQEKAQDTEQENPDAPRKIKVLLIILVLVITNTALGVYLINTAIAQANRDLKLLTERPPMEVVEVKATAISKNAIKIVWKDTENEQGYYIKRHHGEKWHTIATLQANAHAYIDSGLKESTFYSYRVVPFNQFGEAKMQFYFDISATTKSQ